MTESYKTLKRQMKSHLKNAFRGLIDDDESFNFDAEAAIYWFAGDYNEGQFSDLYKILSTSKYRPGPMESGPADSESVNMLYEELEDWYKKGVKNNPRKKKATKKKSVKKSPRKRMAKRNEKSYSNPIYIVAHQEGGGMWLGSSTNAFFNASDAEAEMLRQRGGSEESGYIKVFTLYVQ